MKELTIEQRINSNEKILESLKELFTDIHVRTWISSTVDIRTYPSGYIHIRSSWAGVTKEQYENVIKPWMKANGFQWDASGRHYPEFPHWGKRM